jgi:hypothetical protein
VERRVVAVAQDDQVVDLVRTAVGLMHDMVDLEVTGSPTSRHLAPPVIAAPYQPVHARWNVLCRASWHDLI